ncbi:hypothetical protein NQZ68_004574 [Dissostichus eleginoides]|nr:hypothetical protein NQZ68_004574 [Dissostichus eleginoides]
MSGRCSANPHREKVERGEKEQKVEEAVAMEMVIILDMLRWRFVLPNVQATERRLSNLFLIVQLSPLKCYRSFSRFWSRLVEVRPAQVQLETAGIVHKQCVRPDNAASGSAKPCSARLPVP